jgi:hypothetical protein
MFVNFIALFVNLGFHLSLKKPMWPTGKKIAEQPLRTQKNSAF